MKKYKSLVFLSCCILSFCSSCKKGEGGAAKNNWRVPMIKTETRDNTTNTYWYDNNGRILKLENQGVRTEFTYTSDSVYYKTTELATNAVQKYAGKLNAKGMLVSMNGTEYKYDSDDRLSEIAYPPLSDGWQTREKYYYNSATGLLDSTRQTKSKLLQINWLKTTVYTYWTIFKNTRGNENFGAAFRGKNEQHPVQHTESWTPIQSAPYRKVTYTTDNRYGVDDEGRLVVEDYTEQRPDNSVVQLRTIYTYY